MKDGRLKVEDGDTGIQSWRQGNEGFVRDWDGDPTSKNYNRSGLKERPKHHVKMGNKKKTHRSRMGKKPEHKPKMD